MAESKVPTPEQLAEYDDRLEKLRAAQSAGESTEAAEKELKAFMLETGIAEEAPPDVFEEAGESGS